VSIASPGTIHFRALSLCVFLLLFPTFVSITEEIQKRRTFATISHPDVGTATLTEKLPLCTRG
jgi:hypothetical protein